MNVYCKMCMNKDCEEMCRTCVSDLCMTTDGIKYGLPSNYSNDVRATKAAINAFFGAGHVQNQKCHLQ